MVPFVILALHRTGSVFLVNALNGHPDIVCRDAMFKPKKPRDGIDLSDPIGSLDRWLQTGKDIPFVGFKLMLNHSREVMEEIARRRFRVIFLTRPNDLARHSSQLIARTGVQSSRSFPARVVTRLLRTVNGSYNSPLAKRLIDGTNKFSTGKTVKIRFDRKRFERMRQQTATLIREAEAILAKHNLEPLRVEYPQVTTQEAMRSVLCYLGAEEMDLVSSFKKVNPPNILERFSNPDDVLRYLGENHLSDWASESVTA